MDIVVGPVVDLINTHLIAPFVRRLKYLTSFKDNVSELQGVIKDLQAKRNDEQSKLKAEENAGRVKTHVASNWFEAVSKIEEAAVNIEKESLEEEGARGGGGGCMNCWSRYKLSKRSVDLTEKAKQLRHGGEQIVLTRQQSLKAVQEMPTDSVTIENQPSTQLMLKKILDCIDDPEIAITGICGMGGVGKTTLAKQVNNHLEKNPCFDTVIMVTVSATPNMKTIQTSIGKRLGLDLAKDYNEDDAREKLSDALGRKKKFLLILDDVWPESKFKIREVGIPHPRNHKGSKILVTSRSQDACTYTGATKNIPVQPLSEDESWDLFVEFAGQHVAVDGIECFGREIVKRCKGLPLAIVTAARATANRHGVGEWEDAAREMKQSAANLQGMKDEVFIPLKFSFDRLKGKNASENDMLKNLFLYCACFPEDHSIKKERILDHCIGKGLVDKLLSLTATRNKCDALIGSLKIACMLEDGGYEESVRMHDMLRELGIWIINSSEYPGSISPNKVLTRNEISIKEAPQAHEWSDATWISLVDTRIDKLPELGEMCPKLTTLLFSDNMTLTVIPPTNFFERMDQLTVLDLSKAFSLKSLPDSLSCLVSLRVLRLYGCRRLEVLPTLGMLRQLQVLDLGVCQSLDRQILNSECVAISNLRYLEVADSNVYFQQGGISHLPLLEELKISEMEWRVSGEDNKEAEGSGFSSTESNILDVTELSHLTNLAYLDISFDNITISDWFKPLANKIRRLALSHCSVRQDALEALNGSQKLRALKMADCLGVTCVPTCNASEVDIRNCMDLEKVMEKAYDHPDSFTELSLFELPKLKRIIGNSLSLTPINCFCQLELIEIRNCHQLKMIFTKEMPRLFNNLERIVVSNCNEMEVILEEEEEEEEEEPLVGEVSVGSIGRNIISPFPRLKRLRLGNLAALHDVCSSNHFMHCPLIEYVEVLNCPRLKLNKDTLTIENDDELQLVIIDGLRWEKTNRVKEHEIQASV